MTYRAKFYFRSTDSGKVVAHSSQKPRPKLVEFDMFADLNTPIVRRSTLSSEKKRRLSEREHSLPKRRTCKTVGECLPVNRRSSASSRSNFQNTTLLQHNQYICTHERCRQLRNEMFTLFGEKYERCFVPVSNSDQKFDYEVIKSELNSSNSLQETENIKIHNSITEKVDLPTQSIIQALQEKLLTDKHALAPIVVENMMPFYRTGRFCDSSLFELCARYFTKHLLNSTKTHVGKAIEYAFRQNPKII